jgi:hypothetical protein
MIYVANEREDKSDEAVLDIDIATSDHEPCFPIEMTIMLPTLVLVSDWQLCR